MENVACFPSLLRHPLARRRARQLERTRQAGDQLLAWRVQDIIVGLGLTHPDFSISGGRIVHVPEVLSESGPRLRKLRGCR